MPLDVSGIKELDQALAQLPERLAKRALARAVRSGSAEIRQEARNRAPFKHVRRAIIVRRAPQSGSSIYTVSDDIGINVRVSPDWHWWEFGIPHSWKQKAGQRISWGKAIPTGKTKLYASELGKFYRKPQGESTHPPLTARPFLRPAVAASGQKAVDRMKLALAQAILVEVSRLPKRRR